MRECNSNGERCSLFTACLPASKKAFPKIREPVIKIWTRTFGEAWGGCEQEAGRGSKEMLTIEVGGERFAAVASNFFEEHT
jgi:hypothetical protein